MFEKKSVALFAKFCALSFICSVLNADEAEDVLAAACYYPPG